jgi:hypothetical protein
VIILFLKLIAEFPHPVALKLVKTLCCVDTSSPVPFSSADSGSPVFLTLVISTLRIHCVR